MLPMGVQTHTGELSMEEIIAYGQRAEELGYHALWPTENSGKDAMAVLAAVAARTTKLTMATGIISVYTRTPTLMAMGIAALDGFGERSMILGLGSGGPGFVQQGHGLRFERPLARVREYVSAVREFLKGDRVTVESEHFTIRRFRLRDPRPRPNVRLYLAALGPKMTELAGELVDGIIVNLLPFASLPDLRARLAAGAARAGRDVTAIKICTLLMTCPDSSDPEAIDAMRKGLAFYAGQPSYEPMLACAGYRDAARAIQAAWAAKEFERAAELVTDDILATYTLTGSERDMRAMLGKYVDEGVYPIIYPVDRPTRLKKDMLRCIELGAELAA
ncbi:MAG: LLM class flavin-dependent oxidoreductase [Candidatus Tectomicrobia bacterium]|nr:LLM class flavin-dependent oxidoreductase [Candidatus Tectomicrobia bacterium]